MSTTDLESSLKENEESLKEISELLLLSPEEPELKNLAIELENLIKLQQDQILQAKKKELLSRFGLSEEKNGESGKTAEDADMIAQNNLIINNEDMEIVQPGNKCCIPWTHPDYEKVYFLPGLIHSINAEKQTCEVLILTPITQSIRICEKYISSQCKTTPCPYNCSHGEEISFELVTPYELLNIGNMDAYQVGRYFWAKYKDDEVWYMAKLISIETGGKGFRIIYKGYENEHPNGFVVSHDEIIPVVGLENEHDESDEESSFSEYSDECASLSENDSSSLKIGLGTFNDDDDSSNDQNDTQIQFAEWEKHTRGVASRMMAKMGYKMGEGLGKNSEGITNPIEVKLFTKGVSLDFIDKKGKADQTGPHRRRRRRHKSEGSKIVNSGTHISHGRIKDRIEYSNLSSTNDNNSDPQQTVFDFLNVSLNKGKHRDNSNMTGVGNISTSSLQSNTSAGSSSNNSSTDRSHKFSSEASQLQLYQLQNQLNQKSQELQKAKESFKRNEKKDPTMANHFREKINEIETTYQLLKRKEQEIQRGLDRAKGRKKMTIF
ncbi:819_t:CDS:2 [Funneliformis mosseae]|uniref:819_t:CDS:1 n=1 Tax=Funneliformis mosseae TaxID=27381 RepID=A0A9N8VEW4_FUNMO|nr:819_t:CDS:2 [Funneliformis mosseae]